MPQVSQTKMDSSKDTEQFIPVHNVTTVSNTILKLQKFTQQPLHVPTLTMPQVSQTKMDSSKDTEQSIPVHNVTTVSNTILKLQKFTEQPLQVPNLTVPQVSQSKIKLSKDKEQFIQVHNVTKVTDTTTQLPPSMEQALQVSKQQTSKQKIPFPNQSTNELPSGGFLHGKLDTEIINQMVLSAKENKWEDVWEILDNKPHLVNCIPSDRAWSVLHQAVWHNNIQAVLKILSYPACDTEIRTKQDQTCESGPGMKPIELTQSLQIKDILQSHQGKHMMSVEAPTMLTVDKIMNSLGGCILMTLSCNQGVLIPPKWPIDDHNTIHSIPYIMQAIFAYINKGDRWKNTRDKISLTLQQYSKALGDKLLSENEMTEDTKEKFFRRMIQLYTEETGQIWKVLNQMLRLQDTSICEYQPTSLELSLCPYALLLNSILLHWNRLKGYTGITYRSCSLTHQQADGYVKGHQFIWLSFSSSSKKKGAFKANNYSQEASIYKFIIDNGMYNYKWAPRGIAMYSAFADENECLYPFGAKFEVTYISSKIIHIRLIDY